MAVNRGQMSILCLLDLSAAFDSVDHDLLLQQLERQFGLCGTALQWVRSYLSGRTFRVVYGDMMLFIVYVVCLVPQGSVLGPLFSFCTWRTLRTGLPCTACLFMLMPQRVYECRMNSVDEMKLRLIDVWNLEQSAAERY